jgi:hypothetical protein
MTIAWPDALHNLGGKIFLITDYPQPTTHGTK